MLLGRVGQTNIYLEGTKNVPEGSKFMSAQTFWHSVPPDFERWIEPEQRFITLKEYKEKY